MQHDEKVAAFAGAHEPRPLPFDPAKLTGLSERLIRSHWENNYCGAVKALNSTRTTSITGRPRRGTWTRWGDETGDDQVNPVMSAALDSGLDVTALHNHDYWGVGPAQDLARGLRAALDRTATRLGAR